MAASGLGLRQHQATVEAVSDALPGSRLLVLQTPSLSQAAPGQFVMVRCGSGLDPYLRQAVPIHRLLADSIGLLVRPDNPDLRWLMQRRPGDHVDLVGPCGNGFALPHRTDALAVIVQGGGWTAAAALLDRANCSVQLLVSAATERQLPPRELIAADVEYLGFAGAEQDPRWEGAVAEALSWANRVALAGPAMGGELPALYPTAISHFRESPAGLRRGRAEAWLWGDIRCGLGCCDTCLVETSRGRRRICTDGPVFDLADLAYA